MNAEHGQSEECDGLPSKLFMLRPIFRRTDGKWVLSASMGLRCCCPDAALAEAYRIWMPAVLNQSMFVGFACFDINQPNNEPQSQTNDHPA